MKQLVVISLFMASCVNVFSQPECDVSPGEFDIRLEAMGFVDVREIDPVIVVDLMYARDDNFVGHAMYDGLTKAWLHPEAAHALKLAQEELTRRHKGYSLKVCDASRPMSVQKQMYQAVRGTSKVRYVSNPANGGGLHNYGMAVDVTIVDEHGVELDMGTKVDHLGKEAGIDNESEMLSEGIISVNAVENRRLLRQVMRHGGFRVLPSEWWHFNLVSRAKAKTSYKLLDF
jgi:D-alanyl-D-alanine dipeptidase